MKKACCGLSLAVMTCLISINSYAVPSRTMVLPQELQADARQTSVSAEQPVAMAAASISKGQMGWFIAMGIAVTGISKYQRRTKDII